MKTDDLQRCVAEANAAIDPTRSIVVVPEQSSSHLTSREKDDYFNFRLRFLSWLLNFGKRPKSAEGYSPYTVYADAQRTAAFDRWVWEANDSYVVPPTEDDAQHYFEEIAISDRSRSTKGKIEESLKHYSKWLHHERGGDPWELQFEFDSSGGWRTKPQDYLREHERRSIRSAALDYGGDSWKFTSLVWASLDAALRPSEVMRAKTYWVDRDNHLLRIPRSEDTKGSENWETAVSERTHNALLHWLEERETHELYEDTDTLWMTRYGNPYASKELGRLLRRLCGKVGIDTEHRTLPWYAIRHSVGTLMTKHRDLKATKDQLRHKSALSTLKYDGVSPEDREDVLNRIG